MWAVNKLGIVNMKKFFVAVLLLASVVASAQTTSQPSDGNKQPVAGRQKVYDEAINPMEQIDQALVKAKAEGKFVVCQVGGNWCPWCLKFADFITRDTTISKLIADNFEYIHVNYNPRKSGGEEQVRQAAALMNRLGKAGRFGFPVFVVLDEEGNVVHIQDSSFLEEGQGYNKEKVVRFFKNWMPTAVK